MTSRLVSVLAAVAVGVSSVALFTPISASATISTVTLTSAQTVALFGQTIPCEYLSTDGTYHQTVATYSSTWSVGVGTFYSPDGQSFNGREVCQYTIPYASQNTRLYPKDSLAYQTHKEWCTDKPHDR